MGALSARPLVVCTAATRPAHAAGREIFETDTEAFYVSNGATWKLQRFLENTYGSMSRGADQNITTSVVTAVDFNTQVEEVGGDVVDVALNRFVVPAGRGGVYAIKFNCGFAGADGGTRTFNIAVNGTVIAVERRGSAGSQAHNASLAVDARLAAADAVTFSVFHNLGTTLAINAGEISASIEWIRP